MSETIMKGSQGAAGAAGRSPGPVRSGVRVAERVKRLANPRFSSGQLEGLRGDCCDADAGESLDERRRVVLRRAPLPLRRIAVPSGLP